MKVPAYCCWRQRLLAATAAAAAKCEDPLFSKYELQFKNGFDDVMPYPSSYGHEDESEDEDEDACLLISLGEFTNLLNATLQGQEISADGKGVGISKDVASESCQGGGGITFILYITACRKQYDTWAAAADRYDFQTADVEATIRVGDLSIDAATKARYNRITALTGLGCGRPEWFVTSRATFN